MRFRAWRASMKSVLALMKRARRPDETRDYRFEFYLAKHQHNLRTAVCKISPISVCLGCLTWHIMVHNNGYILDNNADSVYDL